jgi:acyl CoA:acetate/3-ketoacid CoA transferase alpha subunit
VGKVSGAHEVDTGTQRRSLPAIPRRLQAGGSGIPRNLSRSVAGTIVNHDNFFNMRLSALHYIGDVRNFVEGRDEGAGSHI